MNFPHFRQLNKGLGPKKGRCKACKDRKIIIVHFLIFDEETMLKKITAAETKLPHQYVLKYIFLNRIKTVAKKFLKCEKEI